MLQNEGMGEGRREEGRGLKRRERERTTNADGHDTDNRTDWFWGNTSKTGWGIKTCPVVCGKWHPLDRPEE